MKKLFYKGNMVDLKIIQYGIYQDKYYIINAVMSL